MFKALHKDTTHVGQHQPISREEFYNFYEVQDMRWKEVNNHCSSYSFISSNCWDSLSVLRYHQSVTSLLVELILYNAMHIILHDQTHIPGTHMLLS